MGLFALDQTVLLSLVEVAFVADFLLIGKESETVLETALILALVLFNIVFKAAGTLLKFPVQCLTFVATPVSPDFDGYTVLMCFVLRFTS